MFRKILVGMVVGLVGLVGFVASAEAAIFTSISGKVVDGDTGKPIEGAVLRCMNDGLRWINDTTNKNGMFKFRNMPEGHYSFWVEVPGNDFYLINAIPMEVQVIKGKNLTNVIYKLYNGGAVKGIIFEDDGITPVSNVKVAVRYHKSFTDKFHASSTMNSDESGNYLLKSIPEGLIELNVYANDMPVISKEVIINKGVTCTENINLIWDKTTGMEGIVYFSDGTLATNVPVNIGINIQNEIVGLHRINTDINGKFRVLGLNEGLYYVYSSGKNSNGNREKGSIDNKNIETGEIISTEIRLSK